MLEILLTSASLLIVTLGIVFYYRKMKEVSKRYVEAKNILGDIILSFKRDLKKHEDQIHLLSQAIKRFSSLNEDLKKVEVIRDELEHIKKELKEVSSIRLELSTQIKELDEKSEKMLLQQKEFMEKISELEDSRSKESTMREIETAIPLKKERALAPLTETELKVLEMLVNEGEKTASQIKDRIKLTREHTARLMKALYTRGYVERRTDQLPYIYRVKEEMLRVLKKGRTSSEAI